MNDQLKQRLVGAIVLVSLAVIFIPMILPGGGGLSDSVDGRNVPPEPDYRFPPPKPAPEAPPIAGASIVVPIEDSEKDDAKKVAKEKPDEQSDKKTSDKKTAKPVVSAKPEVIESVDIKPGRVNAWIVQVGSFSSEPNARALRDKLRKKGFASFMEAVKGKKGMVYRVRVGPELTRSLAESLQKQLAKDTSLDGLVQSYP